MENKPIARTGSRLPYAGTSAKLPACSLDSERLPAAQRTELFRHAVAHIISGVRTGSLSLGRAMQGKQISYFKRLAGEEDVQLAIAAWLLDLSYAYNITRPLSEEQAADIAMAICRDYWQLKLAEIALFCDQAKSGLYGNAYNGLDRPTIIQWLNKYCEQREAELLRSHEEHKRMSGIAPNVLAAIKEAVPTLPETKKTSLAEKLRDPEYRAWALQYNTHTQKKQQQAHESPSQHGPEQA